MAQNGALSPVKMRAIACLLTSRTVREAAEKAAVAERSLTRWLSEPAFRAELTRQEGELIGELTRSLLTVQGTVRETVIEILTDPAEKGATRLRAAEDLNDIFLRWREFSSLEARIAALEMAQNANQATNPD